MSEKTNDIIRKILNIMIEHGCSGYDNSAMWIYINELISSERERTAKEIFDELDIYIDNRVNTITDFQGYDKIKNKFLKEVKTE